jgi:hypothetical protein
VAELSSTDLVSNYKGWRVKGYVRTHKERQVKMEAFLRSRWVELARGSAKKEASAESALVSLRREDDSRCKELMSEEKAAIARVWDE